MRKPERTKTLPSKFDFDATVNRLVGLLNTKNIRIFAQIESTASGKGGWFCSAADDVISVW